MRSGGTGTLRAFARCGTSRNRAVWYCAATLALPVRHGDPAGAAQEDIGQSFASTRRKSSSLTRGSFHGGVSFAWSCATTRETRFALFGIWRRGLFHRPSPMKHGLGPLTDTCSAQLRRGIKRGVFPYAGKVLSYDRPERALERA